jgi:hypothetical protein
MSIDARLGDEAEFKITRDFVALVDADSNRDTGVIQHIERQNELYRISVRLIVPFDQISRIPKLSQYAVVSLNISI